MSLARVKTWGTNEGLLASDLNAEFENIRTNPTSLISPLTANVAAAGFRVTGLAAATTNGDMARFDDAPLVATQAQQETASNITAAVTPGRQQYHPSAAKAWCSAYFNGTIASAYNINSVSDGGIGLCTVNFQLGITAGAYVASCDNNGTALALQCTVSEGSAGMSSKITAGTLTDAQSYQVTCFGDLA